MHMYDVDLRALLVAVRTAKDGEYVTVESKESNVRVAKNSTCMSNRSDGALRPPLTPFSVECQELPDILAFAFRIKRYKGDISDLAVPCVRTDFGLPPMQLFSGLFSQALPPASKLHLS
jgi:hypothetical protein